MRRWRGVACGGLSWAALRCQCITQPFGAAKALHPLPTAACLPCYAIPCRSTRLLSQPRGEWDMVTRMSSKNLDAFLDCMLTGNTGAGCGVLCYQPGLARPGPCCACVPTCQLPLALHPHLGRPAGACLPPPLLSLPQPGQTAHCTCWRRVSLPWLPPSCLALSCPAPPLRWRRPRGGR
jgi:hypothetical protein